MADLITTPNVAAPDDVYEMLIRAHDGLTPDQSEALNARLPVKVTCIVAETEPVQNGQTASKSFKPAILDNGIRIMIPPFVGADEAIVVNTETFEYSERA